MPPLARARPQGAGCEQGGQSRVPTARSARSPKLQDRARSKVLPGTPARDQQETGQQRRSEDTTGAEAGLEPERGAGMPVAELRQGLGAQGCGWSSQVGLIRLTQVDQVKPGPQQVCFFFFITIQDNCYFIVELRKIR